ncbi:MAG: HEAT repeat domain-containing protein [Sandaracinus sp.]|nr:HEAT repeat domain-containing protein [Sandaracinus sp.]MCB9612177.1 HEAT repeat domain-containing protein [Sandaracinus sp.]MCB9623086.1 HEAT repeat domain-containing protein [Sandaracinus sp.]
MNSFKQTLRRAAFLSLLTALALPAVGAAQPELQEIVVHDRERGELSPGTQAPSPDQLMTAIESNTAPTTLVALLEYGERVECHACVPLLQRALLEHRDPEVRRISAWWLRHRIFALAPIMAQMQTVLATDASATRRARAAMALGEFMDPSGFTFLRDAAMGDTAPEVRAAAVTALGRLNHGGALPVLSAALADTAVEVRRAAISQVLLVNFYRDETALMGALVDDDAEIRMRAARLLGTFRTSEAVPALVGMLETDGNTRVRQAAAWALGRIGGETARGALRTAMTAEGDSLVQNAIEVALAMR